MPNKIVLIQKNISLNTVIHRTGYVEPIELKEFAEIVSFLNKLGYSQLLCTVLASHDENVNYGIKNFMMFDAELSSRSGLVNINQFRYKNSRKQSKNEGPYYCSIQRLNQGVLFPNGLASLCYQDFGLNLILGSLMEKNLEKLYSRIENEAVLRQDFEAGLMRPCINCEYYLPYESNATLYKKIVKCIPMLARNYLNKFRSKMVI